MSNIRVTGARDNGDGIIEMQVNADGSCSVPVSSDPRDVAPAPAPGPATKIVETSGPDTLDIADINDGELLKRVGNQIVSIPVPGGGGGGAQIIGGTLAFDSDGSGDPQTYTIPLLGDRNPSGQSPSAGGRRGGIVLPAGTIANLRVRTLNIDGGDNINVSWHATVYKNHNATAMTLSGTAAETAKFTASTVSVTEFDVIQIEASVTLTDGGSNPTTQNIVAASFEFTPA